MDERIRQLRGGNMDIDLTSRGKVKWDQADCPWNAEEGVDMHQCAVKNTSICPYFCGIQYMDRVLCSYPYNNINKDLIK